MGLWDNLFGKSETKPSKLDKEITQDLVNFGKEVAAIPYMPWMGLSQAGFNPQQKASMQAFADMGNAFGMGMPTDVNASLPPTQQGPGGIEGYSSYPQFEQNLADVLEKYPDFADRYAQFYNLDPSRLFGGEESGTGSGNKGSTSNPGYTGGGTLGGIINGGLPSAGTPGTSGNKGPISLSSLMTNGGTGLRGGFTSGAPRG